MPRFGFKKIVEKMKFGGTGILDCNISCDIPTSDYYEDSGNNSSEMQDNNNLENYHDFSGLGPDDDVLCKQLKTIVTRIRIEDK